MSVRSDSSPASGSAFGVKPSTGRAGGGRCIAVLLAALLTISCDGPAQPTPPPLVEPLRISCPADQALESPNGEAVVVTYPTPNIAGGSAPVELACNPQSGSTFLAGATPVACTATDHDQRTAACGFAIKVGGPPQITCPLDQTAKSPDGRPVVFEYPAPTVVGGTEPISLTCSPESGSPFKVGTTVVACTVHDQAERSAQCNFTTQVHGPELTVTKFVAFGDSVTYGTQPPCRSSVTGDFLSSYEQDIPLLWASAQATTAYPYVLGELLSDRYQEQPVVVVNEGAPGEKVTEDAADRLARVIRSYSPDVLLLQEGANDVNSVQIPVDRIASSLASMVRIAKSRGVRHVLLGTLLPEQASGCRAYAPGRVNPVNDRIRAISRSEGAELVDLYQAFAGQEGTLLGPDGLHPTILGYRKMAETFYATIRDRFEAVPPVTTTLTHRMPKPH